MKGLVKLVLFCLLIIQQDWQAALRVFTFHLPSGSQSSNGCSFGWSRYSCGIRNISPMAPVRSMDRPAEKAWLCLQQLCRQMCIISYPLARGVGEAELCLPCGPATMDHHLQPPPCGPATTDHHLQPPSSL